MPRRVLDLPDGDFALLADAAEQIAVQRRAAAELASAELSRVREAGQDVRTRSVRLVEVLGEAGRLAVAAAALRAARPVEDFIPPAPAPVLTPGTGTITAPTMPGPVVGPITLQVPADRSEDEQALDAVLRAAVDAELARRKHAVADAVNAAAGVADAPPPAPAKAKRRSRKTAAAPATPAEPPRDEELARQALAAGAPDPEGEAAAATPLSGEAAATLANLQAAAATPTPYRFDRSGDEQLTAGTGEDIEDDVEEQGGGS